jgi:hypothetical protein
MQQHTGMVHNLDAKSVREPYSDWIPSERAGYGQLNFPENEPSPSFIPFNIFFTIGKRDMLFIFVTRR